MIVATVIKGDGVFVGNVNLKAAVRKIFAWEAICALFNFRHLGPAWRGDFDLGPVSRTEFCLVGSSQRCF